MRRRDARAAAACAVVPRTVRMRSGGTAWRDEVGGLPPAEGAPPRESDQVQTRRAKRLLFACGRACSRHHPYGIRPHQRLGAFDFLGGLRSA